MSSNWEEMFPYPDMDKKHEEEERKHFQPFEHKGTWLNTYEEASKYFDNIYNVYSDRKRDIRLASKGKPFKVVSDRSGLRQGEIELDRDVALPHGVFPTVYIEGQLIDTRGYQFGTPQFKKFIGIQEESYGEELKVPRVFYHLTPADRVKSILKSGFKAVKSTKHGSGSSGPGAHLIGTYVFHPKSSYRGIIRPIREVKQSHRRIRQEILEEGGDPGYMEEHFAEGEVPRKYALLRVKVPKGTYIADDPEWDGPGAYIIFGSVPPENIRVVKTYMGERFIG